jgi:hypothetical protein
MPDLLTESFCERCGARYTFETPSDDGIRGRAAVLVRALRTYVLSDETSLAEALAEARSERERELSSRQLEAFHQVFSFCLSCRQYVCHQCWNAAESRCLTCAPALGHEVLPPPLPRLEPATPVRPLEPEPVAPLGPASEGASLPEEPAAEAAPAPVRQADLPAPPAVTGPAIPPPTASTPPAEPASRPAPAASTDRPPIPAPERTPLRAPQWPRRPAGASAVWATSSRDVLGRSASGVQACVACGLPLSATARFCRRCGAPQERV